MSEPASGVHSPCVKVCELDQATGMCRGCFRTMEEIANWITYSDLEKLEVAKRALRRKAGLEPGPTPGDTSPR